MKTNEEIEYKSQLTDDEFTLLKESLPFSDGVKQVNYYYDTLNQDLFSLGCMARIREYENYYEFTLKIPKEDYVLEREMKVLSLNPNIPEIKEELMSMSIKDSLELVTTSTTIRYEYKDTFGVWCLDETTFETSHDYEIEYELLHANPHAFNHYIDTLDNLGIVYKKSMPKYLRALHSRG